MQARVLVAMLAMTGCDLVFDLEPRPRDERCPAVFSEQGYMRVPQLMTYQDAEAACRAIPMDTPGRFAHLVVLRDRAEGVELAPLGLDEPWVGLNDLQVEGQHRWITHEATGPIPWDVSQPNESPPPQDCAAWYETGLHDRDCAELHSSICECDAYEVDLERI